MQCPKCATSHIRKNGKRSDKQNHICVDCGRQFIDKYAPHGYKPEVKEQCLKMYANGMGFRGVQRAPGVHHTTVITWVNSSSVTSIGLPRSISHGNLPSKSILRLCALLYSPGASHWQQSAPLTPMPQG